MSRYLEVRVQVRVRIRIRVAYRVRERTNRWKKRLMVSEESRSFGCSRPPTRIDDPSSVSEYLFALGVVLGLMSG